MALFKSKKSSSAKNMADKETKNKEQDISINDTVVSDASKKEQTKKITTFTKVTYDVARVLRRPRITEKATLQAEKGVYVFEIAPDATKRNVAEAIKVFYKVTPVKVNITKIPSKNIFSRARRQRGKKAGGRKAYVYLKKGDKIEIV